MVQGTDRLNAEYLSNVLDRTSFGSVLAQREAPSGLIVVFCISAKQPTEMRFGPMFAVEIRKRRIHHRSFSHWRWHLDEVFVRINGETYYLSRAVDHEGEVVEVFATKRRDRNAALELTLGAFAVYSYLR